MEFVIASEKGNLRSRLKLLHAHQNMICVERICHLWFCFFFFLLMPHNSQDPSSLTRD